MKRNVKNEKVLKAITIGLATMIAATSAPVNVWADGDQTQNVNNEDQNNDEAKAEINEAVETANEYAEELVPPAEEASVSDETSPAPEGSIPAAVEMVGLLVTSEDGQTSQVPGVTDALTQLGEASDKVVEVKGDLNEISNIVATDDKLGAAPIETEFSVPSAEDGYVEGDDENVEGVSILVLKTNELEEQEGKPAYYDDETPVGGGEEGPKSVDYYDENVNGSDFYDSAKDEKPFIKSIVDDYTDAVGYFKQYQNDNTDQSLANAFDAAAEADRKLTIEENKIKALDEAIKDSKAAEEALKAASKDLEAVKAIKEKYDTVMRQYFSKMIVNFDQQKVFNDDGSINTAECVKVLELQKGDQFETSINDKADNPDKNGGNLTTPARKLFCDLVKAHIEELGGKDVKFEVITQSHKEGNKTIIDATEFKSIDNVNVGNLNKISDGLKDGGRRNRFAVSYTLNSEEKTAWFNYVYKSTAKETITKGGKTETVDRGDELDIDNGILYLAEITVENGDLKINKVDTRYDDYSLYANGGLIDNAVNAVKAAEDKSATLKAAVNSIRNKILGVNPDEYSEETLDNMFAELKVSAKYSRVKLNALRELIGPRPDIYFGGGGPEGGVIPGGDITEGDDADVSVVVDPVGGVTFSSTSYGVTPIILPSTTAIFGGTGTAGGEGSGVLGVRTGNREDIGANKITTPAPNKGVVTIPASLDNTNTNKNGKGIGKLVKLEDPVVPLAERPNEEGSSRTWGGIAFLLALGAIGKKMYDDIKKKREEEEARRAGR